MKLQSLSNLSLLAAGATFATLTVNAAPAQAGELYQDWNYAIDSFNDGADAGTYGANSGFEFYGMAMTERDGKVYIGINSNLGLGGDAGGNPDVIYYGDLFFNFTGNGLDDANGSLYGIHFDPGADSDSGVSEAGVYSNVTGKNVAADNFGFKSMTTHHNDTPDGATMADLSSRDDYFQSGVNEDWKALNSIASGTKIGGIDMLDAVALQAVGLDFGNFDATGSQTFGFSFDRSLLPDGDFIAHVFAECINDGMALEGSLVASASADPESVPEPASVLGMLAVSGLALKLRHRQGS